MRVSRIAIVSALLLAAAGCADGQPPAEGPDWKSEQQVWWSDADLVKDAIVGFLRFQETVPTSERATLPYWETVKLILILDEPDDPKSLGVLADLASYQLGASGGEILRCVLLRKGPKIVPYLGERLRSDGNDCLDVLGPTSAVCRVGDPYRGYIEGTLDAVKDDESCYVEP